ncbi:MAG: preprotein translocase subunit SecE [bacterium]|nr:preprotein translocase subunit SecE [bacterium]
MNDNFQILKGSILNFLKGVKIEWGKITWPEKHQVIVETIFVVSIVTIFTVFIFIVDKGLEGIISLFTK